MNMSTLTYLFITFSCLINASHCLNLKGGWGKAVQLMDTNRSAPYGPNKDTEGWKMIWRKQSQEYKKVDDSYMEQCHE